MNRNRESGVLPMYRQVLWRLQPPSEIFACTNFRAFLQDFTWWQHTLEFTLWDHVSIYIHLACKLHSSLYMLMSISCLRPYFGYGQILRFVCVCCVRHERICCTHTLSHIRCRISIVMINDQLIMSVTLVTCTVGQSCWTCVSIWFSHIIIKSCKCMFVWSPMHHLNVHTLSHFC